MNFAKQEIQDRKDSEEGILDRLQEELYKINEKQMDELKTRSVESGNMRK